MVQKNKIKVKKSKTKIKKNKTKKKLYFINKYKVIKNKSYIDKEKKSYKVKKINYQYQENYSLGITIVTSYYTNNRIVHTVRDVNNKGHGYKLGLREHDQIIEINHKKTKNMKHVEFMENLLPPDMDKITVILINKNKLIKRAKFRPQRGTNLGIKINDTKRNLEEGEARCKQDDPCAKMILVTEVLPRSVGKQAGFTVNDEVIGINGISTIQMYSKDLNKLFNPGKKKMVLKINR